MDEVIEIFGKRLKIVTDNDDSADYCLKCAIKYTCFNVIGAGVICKDSRGRVNRHFELINDKLKEKSNMKTTELMIGDWVLVGKEPIQIKQVCEDCIICDFGDGDEEVECFEPILLTADILAKNGLEKRCSDELVLFDNGEINTTIIRYFVNTQRVWLCKRTGGYENEIRINCQYVHELQHALRMCKIDKEIVL